MWNWLKAYAHSSKTLNIKLYEKLGYIFYTNNNQSFLMCVGWKLPSSNEATGYRTLILQITKRSSNLLHVWCVASEKFVCGKMFEKCNYKSDTIIQQHFNSFHFAFVSDIADWGNKNSKLFRACSFMCLAFHLIYFEATVGQHFIRAHTQLQEEGRKLLKKGK